MTAAELITNYIAKQIRESEQGKELREDGVNIDDLEELKNTDEWYEAINDFRGSGEDTDIEPQYCRHFESESVARCIDGVWVGWTYFYGGGKHAEPDLIEWLNDAYFVSVTEEEKLVTVRTFTVVEKGGEAA